jgi:uracil phosphoribosyltransferase
MLWGNQLYFGYGAYLIHTVKINIPFDPYQMAQVIRKIANVSFLRANLAHAQEILRKIPTLINALFSSRQSQVVVLFW